MPRYRMCKGHPYADEDGWVDYEDLDKWEAPKASTAPYVQSDTMAALVHHGTGKVTDSKSRFRTMTKDCGLVEFGTEMPKPSGPVKLSKEKRKDDIRKAVYMLRNGYKLDFHNN